jgi:hypothetical protein
MSLSDHRPPKPKPSVAGTVALIVVGLLILVPSGLCSGVVALSPIIEYIVNPRPYLAPFGGIPFALIGVPFLWIGGSLLWRGIKRWRAIQRDRSMKDE